MHFYTNERAKKKAFLPFDMQKRRRIKVKNIAIC